MEIAGKTNNRQNSGVNQELSKLWTGKQDKVQKRRLGIAHWPSRKLSFLFLAGAVVVLVLISGWGVAAVFKKSLKGAFRPTLTKDTLQPFSPIVSPSSFTPTLQPATPISTKKLPDSCYQNPESKECKSELETILDQECGGDPEAPACATYFQEAVALQTAHECQKDPNSTMCQCLKEKDPGECLGQEIRSQAFGVLFCELAKQPYLGTAFVKLCQQLGGPTARPKTSPSDQLNCQVEANQPDCQVYFETTCSADPYTLGCENYCLENPQAPVCLQRCQTDLTIPGCQELLSTHCPAYPYQPECAAYFEAFCSQQVYDTGCIQYCQQNPYSQGCVGFLLNYCRGNLTDSLCMSVLCDRAPQLCTLCQQFPNLCNQFYQ